MTLSGASMGMLATINVPGSGQVAKFVDEIFPSLVFPIRGGGVVYRTLVSTRAILRISTSGAGISVIGLRGRYNERGDFLITTIPAVSENLPSSNTELVFPHFAESGGYTTQFILFSRTPGQAFKGLLRFFSQSGLTLNLPLH